MLIHHITLATGHTATHRLDTLDAGAVAACRSLLPAGGPIPNCAPWRVEITGPVWTIWRGRDCPVVTCGVGRGHAEPWQSLVDLQARFAPAPSGRAPSGQWLAAVLLPGLALTSADDVGWLGDFERCMAAAVLLPT